MDRRSFLGSAAASAVLALSSSKTFALSTTPRVIVVGGGMAGASVAKYIRLWSKKAGNPIPVLLIDINDFYVSNIMSNLVVTGQVDRSKLNFNYNSLVSKYGVEFVKGKVLSIAPAENGWSVAVDNGMGPYWADRVVLAPGISFDSVPLVGGGDAPILHAWHAGPQTDALKAQLAKFPAGGTYVLSIPKSPYRCPPGPYERACVIADYLKRKNFGAKVLVLDANPSIQAEPENFNNAFTKLYGGMLTYVKNAVVKGVSYTGALDAVTSGDGSSAGTVVYNVATAFDANGAPTTWETKSENAALLNIIPPHRAAQIVQQVEPVGGSGNAARLANSSDRPFARVDVKTFASFDTTNFPGIHIIGDSHQTGGPIGASGLPMAGHVANEEAKICASAIVASLASGPPLAPKYLTANSACYSPINSTTASWLTLVYHYDTTYAGLKDEKQFWPSENGLIKDSKGNRFKPIEAAMASTDNFNKMGKWYQVLMRDSFA